MSTEQPRSRGVIKPEFYEHTVVNHEYVGDIFNTIRTELSPPVELIIDGQQIFRKIFDLKEGDPGGYSYEIYASASVILAGDKHTHPINAGEIAPLFTHTTTDNIRRRVREARSLLHNDGDEIPFSTPTDWIDRYTIEQDANPHIPDLAHGIVEHPDNNVGGSTPSTFAAAAVYYASQYLYTQTDDEYVTKKEISRWFNRTRPAINSAMRKIEWPPDTNC